MVMTRVASRKGDIWDAKKPKGVYLQVNADWYMKKDHFDQIWSVIPYLFADLHDKKQTLSGRSLEGSRSLRATTGEQY